MNRPSAIFALIALDPRRRLARWKLGFVLDVSKRAEGRLVEFAAGYFEGHYPHVQSRLAITNKDVAIAQKLSVCASATTLHAASGRE